MPENSSENGGEKPPEVEEETSAAEEWGRFAIQAGYLLGGGFQLAACTVVAWLLGRWIDGRTGLGVFASGFALLGFVGGVYSLIRMVRRGQQRESSK